MATYFASPTGGGNGLSAGSPFQIINFWDVVQPGDTLILASSSDIDNPTVYTGSSSMLSVSSKNGTSSNPITIKAAVDGGVLIDGQFARTPCAITSSSWIRVEGINFRHSLGSVVFVSSGDDITFSRCIAWDANGTTNVHCVSVTGNSDRVEFVDCAFFGVGRKTFSHSQSSGTGDVTCRRCWIRYEGHQSGGATVTTRYRSFGTKYIDSIITHDVTQVQTSGALGICMINDSHSGVSDCAQAEVLGTLIYVHNQATLGGSANFGIMRQGARDLDHDINCSRYEHVAVIVQPGGKNLLHEGVELFSVSGKSYTNVVRNLTTVSQGGNTIDSGWSIPSGEHVHSTSIPALGSATHPWTATQGANLCYLYGTTTPKWPWPMNDRIKAATGYSGGYSGPCNSGCIRTVRSAHDVTASVENLLGTIPSACRAAESTGFPTTGVVDTGVRANEGPPPSASWIAGPSAGQLEISGNAIKSDLTDGSKCSNLWNPMPENDQEAYVTVSTLPSLLSRWLYILARASDVNNYYRLRVEFSNNQVSLSKVVGGVLQTVGGTSTPAITAGTRVGMRLVGATIEVFVGATKVATFTDSSLTSGRIGLMVDGDADLALNNFGGGEFDDTARGARVSWAETEVPLSSRRARGTWAEVETPEPPFRYAQVSFTEFEIPNAPAPSNRGSLVTWGEMETPEAPRRGTVTHAEMETLGPDRQCVVSWVEQETPDKAPRGFGIKLRKVAAKWDIRLRRMVGE